MNVPCIKCKGNNPKLYCGRSFCPIIAKSEARFKVQDKLAKEDFFGSSPAPFVGRFGYPNVHVGILSVEEKDSGIYDAPKQWAGADFKIPQVVDLRSSLVNSRFVVNVNSNHKFLQATQEVGMAAKPVELEVKLDKKPVFRLNSDAYSAPMGPNASLKSVDITSNPKIPTKVDKIVSDSDFHATDAMIELYEHDFDETYLTRLLSVGNLGVKTQRRIVPTRWSITAVDDNVGKHLIEQVKKFPESDYKAYFGGYLGNYYLILMFPEVWSYELFETYLPKVSWNVSDMAQYSTDYEPYDGRKDYADETAGGYYAARLAILEGLSRQKRQASVLALRFITGDYYLPLGVWVVREASRKAMGSQPIEFASKELMLDYATKLVKAKFGYELSGILPNSIMLRNMKAQKKLSSFFR
jgi:DNA repair protein NreA